MRTFGWICISVGITILVIGVPLIIINAPILTGKAILAVLVNIIGGLIILGYSNEPDTCPYCKLKVDKRSNFCGYCGVQLKRR